VSDDAIVAEYRESRVGVEGDFGFNFSRVNELSGGFYAGRINDTVQAGDPGLPELGGAETIARLRWVIDQQDSEVIPSRGLRLAASLSRTIASPEVPGLDRTNDDLTQAELSMTSFHPVGTRHRLFATVAGGTSFDGHPLPTRQFTVGYPFVLDAFTVGEHRGDHYAVLTVGALRRIGRLPDFLGGPVFAGGWLENGSVFNSHDKVDINSQIGVGVVTETLIGPIFFGTSAGFDGGWRVRFGIGRIFGTPIRP
jgi:NTE family protein